MIEFLIIFLIIIFLIAYNKNPIIKGKKGERKVRRIIGKTKKGKKYVINNLTILNENKSIQIDHIIINPRGIFVIETKNYSGKIYGHEKRIKWLQVLKRNKQCRFYNPIKQNASHIYNVKSIIGELPIYSLIVFVKNNTKNIKSKIVIPISKLRTTLKNGTDVLTIEEMETAYEKLISKNVKISKKQHIKNIKTQQENIRNGICPRCGSELIIKEGKYGWFLGCSNYPKCKFKKSIMQ